MEFEKDIFEKAIKECGIIKWKSHFERVVKSYIKNYDTNTKKNTTK